MRNRKRGRKLKQTPAHRQAMIRNLVTSLFEDGRVITSEAKARESRHLAEKLITLAKDGSQHARDRAIALLPDEQVVDSLFSEIGPRYKDRQGGYSRILKLSRPRMDKYAPPVLVELVGEQSNTEVAPADATAANTEKVPAEAPAEEASESAS